MGSEMCIRDRCVCSHPLALRSQLVGFAMGHPWAIAPLDLSTRSSYHYVLIFRLLLKITVVSSFYANLHCLLLSLSPRDRAPTPTKHPTTLTSMVAHTFISSTNPGYPKPCAAGEAASTWREPWPPGASASAFARERKACALPPPGDQNDHSPENPFCTPSSILALSSLGACAACCICVFVWDERSRTFLRVPADASARGRTTRDARATPR